jgi:superfamily II DNA helicase RecQ
MSIVLQRFGRAARGTGLKALAIFFIESRFIGSKHGTGRSKDIDRNEESDVTEEDVTESTKRQTDAEVRAQLPDVMYEFCNSDHCLRTIILSHYLEEFEGHTDNNPCCSNCQVELDQFAENLDVLKAKRKHFLTGRRRHPIFQVMLGWCCNWVKDRWPASIVEPDPRALISNDELMTVCVCDRAWLMSDTGKMKEHLPDWEWSSP